MTTVPKAYLTTITEEPYMRKVFYQFNSATFSFDQNSPKEKNRQKFVGF